MDGLLGFRPDILRGGLAGGNGNTAGNFDGELYSCEAKLFLEIGRQASFAFRRVSGYGTWVCMCM